MNLHQLNLNAGDVLNAVTGPPPARWTYSFRAAPAEPWCFTGATYQLFKLLNGRVEMDLTEAEFERFRAALDEDGIALREIGRRPYHEAESVP